VLVSILSNTSAKITEEASEEFLFQFAISTLEGVKSDAIFSYQPPFNLLAIFILWPLSFVLSPRALHTVNVFLIRVTSIHVLLIIGIYERYIARGNKLFQSGKGAAQAVLSHLPLQHVSFLEAFTGSQTRDLYEAIFDAPCDPDLLDIFDNNNNNNEEERRTAMTPLGGRSPEARGRMVGLPTSPKARARSTSRVAPSFEMRPPSPSPLERLYGGGTRLGVPVQSPQRPVAGGAGADDDVFSGNVEGSVVKRLEGLLSSAKDLPVVKLREEVKDIQDRQARIETLLVSLTKSLRGESVG